MKKLNKDQLTFENVPEYTYWRNPKTGTILSLPISRNHEKEYLNDSPRRLHLWTCNTRNELLYAYSWDEIVEKFEYLGESDGEEVYTKVLSNKRLFREYKLAKKRLSRLRKALKREPDAGHDVELEKMLGYIEKYNNLESFEFDYSI